MQNSNNAYLLTVLAKLKQGAKTARNKTFTEAQQSVVFFLLNLGL